MRGNNKMKKQIVFIMMLILIATSNSYAVLISADLANTTNPSALGNFTGSFDYSSSSNIAAQITVALTNTSPAANGGFLTAFAFNNPFNSISTATLSGDTTSGDFNLLGGASFNNSVDANPWGSFDIGAASTTSWLSGGSPNTGIGVGETETFIFDLIGLGLDQLTTQDFIDTLSTGGEYWFGARFRGFDDGGSDKLPGTTTIIPEPSTLLLLGTGLAGFILSRRKLQ
jgi:hypothetical protein